MPGISKRGRLTLGSSVQKFRFGPFLGFAERRGKRSGTGRMDGDGANREETEKYIGETDEETRGKKSN